VRVFSEMRPVVYTEMLRKHAARFDYHPNEIIAMFKEWGYCCCTSDGERLIPFEEMTEATVETNFFLLHEEKHQALLSRYRA
ncbi:MAG: FkbM family methyltransferase, partial [Selenomonas artemidis]